jgi:hypothetical protein
MTSDELMQQLQPDEERAVQKICGTFDKAAAQTVTDLLRAAGSEAISLLNAERRMKGKEDESLMGAFRKKVKRFDFDSAWGCAAACRRTRES